MGYRPTWNVVEVQKKFAYKSSKHWPTKQSQLILLDDFMKDKESMETNKLAEGKGFKKVGFESSTCGYFSI